jgi:hypothetical protein
MRRFAHVSMYTSMRVCRPGDTAPLALLMLNNKAEAAFVAAAAKGKGGIGGKPTSMDPPGTCQSPGDVLVKIELQV